MQKAKRCFRGKRPEIFQSTLIFVKTFLFFVCLLFPSCKESSLPYGNKSQLNLNFYSEPGTLDPRRATYSNSINIYPMLFDGLMRFDQDGRLITALAKNYTCSDDGKTYTFHLKKANWSNGDPVTAYDFEYSWKEILNPNSPSPLAANLYSIKNARKAVIGKVPLNQVGVFATDSETLVVELKYPNPHFLEELTLSHFLPVNRHYPRCFDKGGCIGNGPFLLKEWIPHQQIVLVKNPHYWDQKRVKLDEIQISFLNDPNTELKLFEKGQLDWAGDPLSIGIPPHAIPKLKKTGQLQSSRSIQTYFYSFNHNHPLLRIQQIRKALSLSIPREDITEHVTGGNEEPALHFLPKELSFQTEDQKSLSDQELKELFSEGLEIVGKEPYEVSFVISYNTGEMHHGIAQIVQHRWKELFGIDVRLKPRDWKAHLSEVQAGNFQIARFSWRAINSDPYSFLELFLEPHHQMHHTSWNSPHFTKALLSSRTLYSTEEKIAALALAEDLLERENVVAPIYYPNVVFVKHPQLEGFTIGKLGMIDFKYAYFKSN